MYIFITQQTAVFLIYIVPKTPNHVSSATKNLISQNQGPQSIVPLVYWLNFRQRPWLI